MLVIPALVRRKALALGAGNWLEQVPRLLTELEREWGISVGRAYGASEAFVAEVAQNDGTPAVLKLVMPRNDQAAAHEITALRLTAGDGCVRLLRDDVARGALLLERLGHQMFQLQLPMRERHEILCSLASIVWRPASGAGLPTGADKAQGLAAFIVRMWKELDRPCSERAIDHAIACCLRRAAAHDDSRAVLVHGDVHQWNALEANGSFKLVDPDGLLAEPEYDLGIIMREDPVELVASDPYERMRWLAARTGLDAAAIWEWGVAERVSTGLWCTKIDLQPGGRQMLDAADRVAAWPVQ